MSHHLLLASVLLLLPRTHIHIRFYDILHIELHAHNMYVSSYLSTHTDPFLGAIEPQYQYLPQVSYLVFMDATISTGTLCYRVGWGVGDWSWRILHVAGKRGRGFCSLFNAEMATVFGTEPSIIEPMLPRPL